MIGSLCQGFLFVCSVCLTAIMHTTDIVVGQKDPIACDKDNLRLECGPGDVVTGEILLGVPEDPSNCSHSPDDCLFSHLGPLQEEVNDCLWKKDACDISWATFGYMCLANCKPMCQYMIAKNFACVEESKIHNICPGGMIMGQSGYMTSPRYPHVYSPDLDCSVTISVEANTNFMVTILGSDLPSDTCSDRLKISPSNGQFTEFCEQVFLLPVQMNFSFHNSGDIEFRFSTRPDTTHHHKGFSLRFDKTPLPPGQQTTTGTTNSPDEFTTSSCGRQDNICEHMTVMAAVAMLTSAAWL